MRGNDPGVAPEDAELLLNALPDPVAQLDAELVIRRINEHGILLIRRYLGDDAPDPIGQQLSRFGGAGTLPIEGFLRRVMRQGRAETLPEVEIPFEAGGRRLTLYFEITAIPLSESAPGVLAIGRDRTEHRILLDQLRHDALHDPLTGLPNRAFLTELLTLAAHRAERESGYRFGVIYLDLDGFKEINDRHGHPFGDCVLAAVGDRLRRIIRKSDTVARVGGDEFVILADPIQGNEGLQGLSDRLRRCLCEPLTVKGTRVAITASQGLVVCGHGDSDPEVLIARADEAMYRAKRSGKARSSFVPRDSRPAREP